MSKVNIIIPVYNSEKYLKRCLDSITNQTFKDFEVIAINDGSTDSSLNILNEYKNILNIKIINQKNMGVAKAREIGIKNSTSPYITFIDSDDYIDNDYLKKLVYTLESTNTNICCSRFSMHFNIPLINKIPFNAKKIKLQKVNLYNNKSFLIKINVVTTGKLYKKDYILKNNKLFVANEDLSINYLMFAKANDISFVNNTRYHYVPNSFGLVITKISGYEYEKIINTMYPLSHMKDSFKNNNLFEHYYQEIECLFIRNLFQRIEYISKNIKNTAKKEKLISCIISYLNINFPNWKNNIYYKRNFIDLEIPDMINCINIKSLLNNLNLLNFNSNEEQILLEYKKYSRT